jgi:hypothetical protein
MIERFARVLFDHAMLDEIEVTIVGRTWMLLCAANLLAAPLQSPSSNAIKRLWKFDVGLCFTGLISYEDEDLAFYEF